MKHSQGNEQPQQYNQRLLEEAYYQHAGELRYYCLGRVSDEQLAEDIVQEAYSRAHEYLKENKHVQVENFRAFLYKFVYFILLEQKYKEGREVFIPEAKTGMEGEWVPDANNNLIDDLENQLYREEVIAWALQGLTDRVRQHLAPHLVGINGNGAVEPLQVGKGRLSVQASQAKRALGENIKARLLLDSCRCPELKQALRQNWLKNGSNGVEANNIRRIIKLINNHESKCPHCQKELNKLLLTILKWFIIIWSSFKLSASEVRAAFGWGVGQTLTVILLTGLLFFTLVRVVGNDPMVGSNSIEGNINSTVVSWTTATASLESSTFGMLQTLVSSKKMLTVTSAVKIFPGITPFPSGTPSIFALITPSFSTPAPVLTAISVSTHTTPSHTPIIPLFTPTPTSTPTTMPTNTPLPLMTLTPTAMPLPLPTMVPTPSISFWADRVQVEASHCTTTLHWVVEGVQAVHLLGQGVIGHGQRNVCPQTTTTYQLQVIHVGGSVEMRYVTVEVVSSTPPTVPASRVIEPTDTPNSGSEPTPAPLLPKPTVESTSTLEEPTPVPLLTATPTNTSSPTSTPTVAPTNSATPTALPTTTPTVTPVPTNTPTVTASPTDAAPPSSPTVTPTATSTPLPTSTPTPTATPVPPKDTPTLTPSPTATQTPTEIPTTTATPDDDDDDDGYDEDNPGNGKGEGTGKSIP